MRFINPFFSKTLNENNTFYSCDSLASVDTYMAAADWLRGQRFEIYVNFVISGYSSRTNYKISRSKC